MKQILIVLLMSMIFYSAQAQNKEDKQKLTREQKKELKIQRQEETRRVVDSIVELRQFVLEANYIKSKGGNTFSVNSTINFVVVDSVKAVFQFGSAHLVGVNGVGGVTVEGDITAYDMQKREKSGSYYIKINISASTGFYEIRLNISSGGMADAQITALSSNRINYSGIIVPLQQSRIYKGMSY